MKIVNGKVIPPYNVNKIKAAVTLLDRVETKGVMEAAALVQAAELLQAIVEGHYEVRDLVVPPANGHDKSADNPATAKPGEGAEVAKAKH